jgi:hypothetical protein
VSASTTGEVATWSLSQKKIVNSFVVPSSIDYIAASRDASVLIIVCGTVVSLFRASSNEMLAQFVANFDVSSAEFTPDSRWIIIVGSNEILFRQVSGGCASHAHKFDAGNIMAIAAASGRFAVLNLVVDDDGNGRTNLYESGDAGYGTLWPAKGNLQMILSR